LFSEYLAVSVDQEACLCDVPDRQQDTVQYYAVVPSQLVLLGAASHELLGAARTLCLADRALPTAAISPVVLRF
jgi:hypothetical protein